jgi:hypothetical protein
MDKEMLDLNSEVQVAQIKLQADRARMTFFARKIPEVTQEHVDGNLGSEYALALNAYDNYKRNNPYDVEGTRREYAGLLQINTKLNDQLREILAPLKEEAEQAIANVTKYKRIYDSAYDKLHELDLEKFELVKELEALIAQDTALNQPPPSPPQGRGRRLRRSTHNKGKKRRRSTHNKGKKRRHSTHKRKKKHY